MTIHQIIANLETELEQLEYRAQVLQELTKKQKSNINYNSPNNNSYSFSTQEEYFVTFEYLGAIQQYKKAIKQRIKYLKEKINRHV